MTFFRISAFFGAALGVTASVVHPGPPVVLDVRVSPTEVRWTLRGEQSALHPWLGLEQPLDLTRIEERSRVEAAVASTLRDSLALTIDGVRASPRLEVVRAPDRSWFDGEVATEIELVSPVSRLPTDIGVRWQRRFDQNLWEGRSLPVRVACFGRHEFHALSEIEPECHWHVGRSERRRAGLGSEARDTSTVVPAPPTPSWPLWAIVPLWLLGGALWWRARSRRGRWILLPSLVLATVGLVWAQERLSAPPDALEDLPQRERFVELQRRLYAAFDTSDASEAYDRLAECLHPTILDEEYQRLFESLVLRDEGGVVCQVERIEVLDGEVLGDREPPTDPPAGAESGYWIRWHWRVHGRVSHWGHEHARSLELRAEYWVARIPAGWRIARTDILEQTRLETD